MIPAASTFEFDELSNPSVSSPPSKPATATKLDRNSGVLAAGIWRLWVPGPLPGLNEIIEARMIRKGKWNAYADMKAKNTGMVKMLALRSKLPKIDRAHFSYLLYEPNMKRDPSNVLGGAMKFIEDGLVAAGVLANDGWNQVISLQSQWFCDKNRPGVAVFLTLKPIALMELFRLDRQT
jgi:hypothetical protein